VGLRRLTAVRARRAALLAGAALAATLAVPAGSLTGPAGGLVGPAGLLAVPPADAAVSPACATNSRRSISGTVFGQDGRDVNVSIGFDLVDARGRALNGDPAAPGYGCAKTGGYSVPQRYLNHFVGPEGQPPGSLMHDAKGAPQGRTSRAWRLDDIPSNAVGAYVEVYSRGYLGSPCKDAQGRWCFNPQALTKYGNSNKHTVPVGTRDLPVRLPLTCRYGGTAGSIAGRLVDAAGRPARVRSLYAWTETKWNAAPFYQGWGIARLASDGSFSVPALASRQRYVIWATTLDGRVVKRSGIPVADCRATPVTIRV
jgi:hypothetical protein